MHCHCKEQQGELQQSNVVVDAPCGRMSLDQGTACRPVRKYTDKMIRLDTIMLLLNWFDRLNENFDQTHLKSNEVVVWP